MRAHFAYVFERFPSFTQTFCVREVLEMERQGTRLRIFSIRDTRGEIPKQFPAELYDRVTFLPPEEELAEEVAALRKSGALPHELNLTYRHWGQQKDKKRLLEATWIGHRLQQEGIRHVHSHFAGVGARVCWWLAFGYGMTFSFTGHANDIFCEERFDVSLARLMRDASAIITVSDYTAKGLKSTFPASASKVRRVYNGLDLSRFAVARAIAAEGEPALILSVGRLIEKKGFDDLITACGFLKQQGLHFRCEIIGDGPMEEELKAMIQAHGLSDHVILAGPQPQEVIRERLSRTAIFALPCVTEKSGGKDNLPTVLMEAMAARVPCVSTRLAGVPEMVEEGVTGLLTDERQPQAFAEALATLLRDPALAQRMGEAGLVRCQRLFAQAITARHLRRELTSRGLVRFDPLLLLKDPALALSYLGQLRIPLGRLLSGSYFKHRRPPEFLHFPESA